MGAERGEAAAGGPATELGVRLGVWVWRIGRRVRIWSWPPAFLSEVT